MPTNRRHLDVNTATLVGNRRAEASCGVALQSLWLSLALGKQAKLSRKARQFLNNSCALYEKRFEIRTKHFSEVL